MQLHFQTAVLATLALLAGGCAAQKLGKVVAEKEQLLANVQEQKQANELLAEQLQTASERLAEAERDLALADAGRSPRSTNTNTVARSKSRTESPAKKPASSSSLSLEQLARQESLLQYDSRQRAARLGIEVEFDNENRLTMDSRRELGKAAELLTSAGASRYGARIRGLEAKAGDSQALTRANAVADYLRLRGVSNDRLAASTRAAQSLLDEEGRTSATPTGGVEIDLVELSGSVAQEGWKASDRR